MPAAHLSICCAQAQAGIVFLPRALTGWPGLASPGGSLVTAPEPLLVSLALRSALIWLCSRTAIALARAWLTGLMPALS